MQQQITAVGKCPYDCLFQSAVVRLGRLGLLRHVAPACQPPGNRQNQQAQSAPYIKCSLPADVGLNHQPLYHRCKEKLSCRAAGIYRAGGQSANGRRQFGRHRQSKAPDKSFDVINSLNLATTIPIFAFFPVKFPSNTFIFFSFSYKICPIFSFLVLR